MINKMMLVLLFLVSSNAWALSSLKCSSNQAIGYSNENHVGGAHPFPGMVTNVEEITQGGVVAYRLVTRESCDGRPDCMIQNPELEDILPSGYSFAFYPETKVVLSSGGEPGIKIDETYAIQFRVGRMHNIWMLCEFWQIFAP